MFKPVIKSNGSSHNSALLEAYFKSQAPQLPSAGLSPLPSVKRDRPTEVIKPGIEMGKSGHSFILICFLCKTE